MKDDLKYAFGVRFNKNTDKRVVEFANMQTNFSNAFVYLIEKEIYENGLRDLSEHIPYKRDEEYFIKLLGEKKGKF